MADEIGEIRARINIVDLVGQTVPLKRTGNRYQGLCPFHQDRNPSFSVTPETGRYRCWSCGESGDIFNWVMKTRNVEFREALVILAEQAGVVLKSQSPQDRSVRANQRSAMETAQKFFREQFSRSKEAQAYCESRGLTDKVLDKWEIGFAPEEGLAMRLRKEGFRLADCKVLFLVDGDESQGYRDKFRHRLIFPIRDERGDLVAFGGRAIGDAVPKYINSSETPLYIKSKVLYAMHIAKDAMRTERSAVLTEGYMDAIACHTAGVKNAVASCGTSFTAEQAKLLKRWCDTVTVLYDSDAAGQNAAAKVTEILAAQDLRVRVASVPEGKDPDTLLRAAGPEAVRKAAEMGLSPLEFRIRSLERKHSSDSDEFWTLVVEALAQEPSEMERLRFIEDLAPRYPKVNDAQAARNALVRQVQKAHIAAPARREETHAVVPSRAPVALERSMYSDEITLFRAVLDEEFREDLWQLLGADDFLVSRNAQRLAHEILKSFPNGMPSGPARQWVNDIELDKAKDLLLSVEQDVRMSSLTQEYVADAVKRLKERRIDRRVEALKAETGEDRLKKIYEDLKLRKGD